MRYVVCVCVQSLLIAVSLQHFVRSSLCTWTRTSNMRTVTEHRCLTFGCCPEKLCMLHVLRLWAAGLADIWSTKYRNRRTVGLWAQFTRCDEIRGNVSTVTALDGDRGKISSRYSLKSFSWDHDCCSIQMKLLTFTATHIQSSCNMLKGCSRSRKTP